MYTLSTRTLLQVVQQSVSGFLIKLCTLLTNLGLPAAEATHELIKFGAMITLRPNL